MDEERQAELIDLLAEAAPLVEADKIERRLGVVNPATQFGLVNSAARMMRFFLPELCGEPKPAGPPRVFVPPGRWEKEQP